MGLTTFSGNGEGLMINVPLGLHIDAGRCDEKMKRALLLGRLDDGPRRQRAIQITKPMGCDE